MARTSSGGRVTGKASGRRPPLTRGRKAASDKRASATSANGRKEPLVVFFDDIRLVRDLLGDYDANLAVLEDRLGIQAVVNGNVVSLRGPEQSRETAKSAGVTDEAAIRRAAEDSVQAMMLIRTYRVRGHLAARLDPLGLHRSEIPADLTPAYHGFSDADLDTMQLLRCAFDPVSICNPGKVFPTPRMCGEVPGPYRQHPAEKAGLADRM